MILLWSTTTILECSSKYLTNPTELLVTTPTSTHCIPFSPLLSTTSPTPCFPPSLLMDSNLIFPALTLPQPPPPLDSLLITIVNDKHTTSIPNDNPLAHNNVPDTPLAHETVFGLYRVYDTLLTLFSSPNHIHPYKDFLCLLNEIFSTAHEGIWQNQTTSSNTFQDLTVSEEAYKAPESLRLNLSSSMKWRHSGCAHYGKVRLYV